MPYVPASQLLVGTTDLVRTAKQLTRANKSAKRESAVLSFDGQALQIEISGMTLRILAQGTWNEWLRCAGPHLLQSSRPPSASTSRELPACWQPSQR